MKSTFENYKAMLANTSEGLKEKLLATAEKELSGPEFWTLRTYAYPDLEIC